MQKRNRKKLKWNSSQNISWFELEGGGKDGNLLLGFYCSVCPHYGEDLTSYLETLVTWALWIMFSAILIAVKSAGCV